MYRISIHNNTTLTLHSRFGRDSADRQMRSRQRRRAQPQPLEMKAVKEAVMIPWLEKKTIRKILIIIDIITIDNDKFNGAGGLTILIPSSQRLVSTLPSVQASHKHKVWQSLTSKRKNKGSNNASTALK